MCCVDSSDECWCCNVQIKLRSGDNVSTRVVIECFTIMMEMASGGGRS